jgi:hypothetical protein
MENLIANTQKLLHATAPYTGATQRRTLFYKYLPYGVERADVAERKHYDLTVPGITAEQRLILGWPEEWRPEEWQPSIADDGGAPKL